MKKDNDEDSSFKRTAKRAGAGVNRYKYLKNEHPFQVAAPNVCYGRVGADVFPALRGTGINFALQNLYIVIGGTTIFKALVLFTG